MKVLVVAVMFIVVPRVFAADVVWWVAPPFSLTPGGGGQKSSQAPKDRMPDSDEKQAQAQNPQQNAGNKPILKAEPDTQRTQTADQQSNRAVNPNEESQGSWDLTFGIIGTVLGVGALFFGYRQVFYAKRADRREEQSVLTAVDASLMNRVKDRADLLVEQCSFEGEFKSNPLKITLSMTNTGGIRATIVACVIQAFVGDHPPIPLADDKLLQRILEGFVIPPQRTCNHHLSVNPIIPEDLQAVREERKTLYIHGRFLYRDGFREPPCAPYNIFFLMRYDIGRKQFLILKHGANA